MPRVDYADPSIASRTIRTASGILRSDRDEGKQSAMRLRQCNMEFTIREGGGGTHIDSLPPHHESQHVRPRNDPFDLSMLEHQHSRRAL